MQRYQEKRKQSKTFFRTAKANVAYNFHIIENNFLFICQVSIVIWIPDMATNSCIDEQDRGVCKQKIATDSGHSVA